jgi:hypothetical protein
MVLGDAVAFRDARLEVMERRLGEERPRRPYPLMERLRLLWLIDYCQIPKRRVKDTFGVARSSVHRWLKAFHEGTRRCRPKVSYGRMSGTRIQAYGALIGVPKLSDRRMLLQRHDPKALITSAEE